MCVSIESVMHTLSLYSDGSGCSGVFVVLYTQLERLKTEHLLDVFQGVKSARTQRMGIVHNAVRGVVCHFMCVDLARETPYSFWVYYV